MDSNGRRSSQEELDPSDLGTLDFWENAYSEELENFRDHGDVGEVWFGRGNALKAVRWIATKLNLDRENDKIIDVGCGNGVSLVELANKGFKKLKGVDYSQKAIDLAQEVLKEHGLSSIELETCDLLSDESRLSTDFKVVHDKGTYDAISLDPDDRAAKRRKYIERVKEILLPDGFLVLTSCNWTKDELENHFREHFEIESVLPADTFQFGGQSGNTVTQLVFRKKQ